MSYHLVCGLEIHTELKTNSKMFCGCKNDPFGAPKPNIYTCPVCLGLPGALPVANKKAIEWTIKLGLFLGCKINLDSKFDRKNYFYPDLPKSYQISQFDLPFCYAGHVDTDWGVVRINRIHLEEDTAKLLHQEIDGQKVTLIDFNRSSVPLIEIVTEPDIINSQQAKQYAKKIQEAVRLLGIGDADMQKGGMRLEANISLRDDQQVKNNQLPDYKVEVKNINSFNFMGQAIDYEIKRQTRLLEAGEKIKQETRGWDSVNNKTFLQRSKENAADYRYFPDPDLPVVHFEPEQIEAIRQTLPLTHDAHLSAWEKDYGIEPKYGQKFMEKADQVAWADELWQQAKKDQLDPNKLANFLANGKIDYHSGETVAVIIERFRELTKVASSSNDELTRVIDQVLRQNSAEVTRFQAGEKKLLGFFMGQIMKAAGKKLDAAKVNQLLRQQLQA
ncbi:Asp-tRNA(Asn)/Glu-tRNA(Gln) amidotransferase subunit GatB [bacterium]|nr:Asp-tRNA(Asn)/Glu-tRNA(Gln) amidotransferase subunit GatB [bacterium]